MMLRWAKTFFKKNLEIAPQNVIAPLHTYWKGLTRDIFQSLSKKNLILRHTFKAHHDSIGEGNTIKRVLLIKIIFGGRRYAI